MVITLKNNKKLDLKWSFLVLEYLEEYSTDEGSGIVQIRKDISKKKNLAYINAEQLKYVKQAVLGMEFKAAKEGQYYAEVQEYKYKY